MLFNTFLYSFSWGNSNDSLQMTLYKYLHPDRIDLLQNLLIRFTQPGAFNDPFEMQPYFDSYGEDNLSLKRTNGGGQENVADFK